MYTGILLICVVAYFTLLLVVAYFTSKKSDNDSFFIGNRNSKWMLVSFGMIGTSLSGVTFVSVPGTVGSGGFQYFQVVFGYFIGYFVIAFVLLPLYYRLHLTSIYSYLESRFGINAYKTGALFFIISRTLGATARLYLVVNILQIFLLNSLNIPFWLTTIVILILILLYTFEGGVKTIIYTDTLQTTFMLVGLIVCLIAILKSLNLDLTSAWIEMKNYNYSKIINTDINTSGFFLKQIISGMLITICMTGLDQEMMQKNISVKTLGGSQKNMITFSSIMLIVNFLFLFLGGALYLFAAKNGITAKGDDLFPTIALNGYLPAGISIMFIIGLISALFPSADGALTALTSSFSIDILGIRRNNSLDEKQRKKIRMRVHLTIVFIFFLCIMIFKIIDNKSIIDVILKLAGYTYGPILGLFTFGLITKRTIRDKWIVPIAVLAPVISYLLDVNSKEWFNGFTFGFFILAVNGILTFLGLLLISRKNPGNEMTRL